MNPEKIIAPSIVILALLMVSLLLKPFSIVDAGHVGIVKRFSAVSRVAHPGFVWRLPIIESVTEMETRVQKEQVEADAASKDLQDVGATIAINFHLDATNAAKVYQDVGTEYRERLIDPAIQEAFKATTAKFTAEELITQREAVKKDALGHIKERLQDRFIIVDDLNIVNFNFSKEFNAAIEQKQVAQQNVEKEKQNLAKIKVEAEQARQQAQGQADAQKLLRDAGSLSQEYLDYLAVQKWDGKLPNVTGGATPFINIPNN